MNFDELKTVWKNKYSVIFEQLDKVKKINSVATAFNTNIDAIYKISGDRLKDLILQYNLDLNDLDNITLSHFRSPEDVILGIVILAILLDDADDTLLLLALFAVFFTGHI